MDNVEIRLTPHKHVDSSEMALQIWDKRQNQVMYESVAPMVGSAQVEFQANLAPDEGTLFRFHIMLSRVGSRTAGEDPLQNRITIDAKNMPVGQLLGKLAESQKFNLLLGSGFPASKKTTVSVRDVPVSQLLDVIASGTHSQWSADDDHDVLVVRFDPVIGPDGAPGDKADGG